MCLEVYPMGSDELLTFDLIPVTASENNVLTLQLSSSLNTQGSFGLTTASLWHLMETHEFAQICTYLERNVPRRDQSSLVMTALLEAVVGKSAVDNDASTSVHPLIVLVKFLDFSVEKLLTPTADCPVTDDLPVSLLAFLMSTMLSNEKPNDFFSEVQWINFLTQLIQLLSKVYKKLNMEEVSLAMMNCMFLLLKKYKTPQNFLPLLLNVLKYGSVCEHSSVHLQAKSLDLLSIVAQPTDRLLKTGQTLQHLVMWYADDSDARLRERALLCLLHWSQRGFALSRDLYDLALGGLKDETETVRQAAIHLLSAVIQALPDERVRVPSHQFAQPCEKEEDEPLRLADAGFAQLCGLMQDACVCVRTLVAKQLGVVSKHVTENYLLQTLDKKVMSLLRVKKSQLTTLMESRNEWASGRQWNADAAPQSDNQSEEEITLLAMGACGAIIHGLEDEFSDVRLATVEAVRVMGCHTKNQLFPLACQDFLVDMLTDDLATVRIRSVHALRTIAALTVLRKEQLIIVLGGLREANNAMRWTLHRLLDQSQLATDDCIMLLITALLGSLKQYPQDQRSIWQCAAAVGRHHAEFVYLNVNQLLQLHPYLIAPEPSRLDPHYITVLLMVINACATTSSWSGSGTAAARGGMANSNLAASLYHYLPDPHARKNLAYLRELTPDLLPDNLPDGDEALADPGALFTPLVLASALRREPNNSSMHGFNGLERFIVHCRSQFDTLCRRLNATTTALQLTTADTCPDWTEFGALLSQLIQHTHKVLCLTGEQPNASVHTNCQLLLHEASAVLHVVQLFMLHTCAHPQHYTAQISAHHTRACRHLMHILHLFSGVPQFELEENKAFLKSILCLEDLLKSSSDLHWPQCYASSTAAAADSKTTASVQLPQEVQTSHFVLLEPQPHIQSTSNDYLDVDLLHHHSEEEDHVGTDDVSIFLSPFSHDEHHWPTALEHNSLKVSLTAGLAATIHIRATLRSNMPAELAQQLTNRVHVCVQAPDGRVMHWRPQLSAWTVVPPDASSSPSVSTTTPALVPVLHELSVDVPFGASKWSSAAVLKVLLVLQVDGTEHSIPLTHTAHMLASVQAVKRRSV